MYRSDKWIDAAQGKALLEQVAGIVVEMSNRQDIPERYLNSYRAAWIGHHVMRLLYKEGIVMPGSEKEQISIDDVVKVIEGEG